MTCLRNLLCAPLRLHGHRAVALLWSGVLSMASIAPPVSAAPAAPATHDIYVEIDWMENASHSHRPAQCVIDKIVETFAREGFNIHIDVSNAVPHVDELPLFRPKIANSPAFAAIKAANFNHAGDSRYYYSLWCHRYSLDGMPTSSSGIANLGNHDHVVSLGSFSGGVGTHANQVGTFIHELGHNLGQHHGGGITDSINYKPNYLSIMNYFYQLNGIGNSLVSLGFAPTSGGHNDFGYSHGELPPLNELCLDEANGIGLGHAFDWNCDGRITDCVSSRLHDSPAWCFAAGTITVLDFNNWGSIPNYISAESAADGELITCITAEEYDALRMSHGGGPEGTSSFCTEICAPDTNGSGEVNSDDLLAVIIAWGPCPLPCPPACGADVAPLSEGDCVVNVEDLLAVVAGWGPCP